MFMDGDIPPGNLGGAYDSVTSYSPRRQKGVPPPRKRKLGGMRKMGKAMLRSGRGTKRRK
jgi:hypothetical protein